jgi:hypothetical protein
MQLSASAPIVITPDTIVRFGISDAKVRFVRKHFIFCATRLDKADRDLLKKRAKAIGAKLVEEVQLATHVVSNKAAATVKTLSAIVSNIPIVNMSWLDFVDTDSSCEIIPLEADCPPSTLEDFKVVSIMDSRSGVLMNRSVFLTDPIDEQYVGIVQGCGGKLVRLYPSNASNVGNAPAVQLRTRKSAAVQQKASATAAYDIVAQLRSCLLDKDKDKDIATALPPVVFFDETGSGDRCTLPPPFLQLLQESGAEWLTVGQLAAAVLSCKPPVLASLYPLSMPQTTGGTGQLQATRSKLAHSQLLPSAEPPALPSDSIAVVNIVGEQPRLGGDICDLEVVEEGNWPSADNEAQLAGDPALVLLVESKEAGSIVVDNNRVRASEIDGKIARTVLIENRSASVNNNTSVSAEGWSESDRMSKKPRLRIDSSSDVGGRNQLAADSSAPPLQHPSSQHEPTHEGEKILQLAVPGQVSTSCYYESDSIRQRTASTAASADVIGDASIRDVKRFTKNAVSVATAFDTMRFRKFDFVLPKETDREIQVRHRMHLIYVMIHFTLLLYSNCSHITATVEVGVQFAREETAHCR